MAPESISWTGRPVLLSETEHDRRLGNNGVLRMRLPRHQVVVACGNADTGRLTVVDEGRYTVVVNGTATPATGLIRPPGCGCERDGEIPPVQEILARGMAPVDGAVKGAAGIMLVVHREYL